jgi:glycosyltransferase involved in cell wall biosynthesis
MNEFNQSTALVSIIMPAYNGEAFITQAIDSVLMQTYPHWELIVVNDGSTDATAQIVSAYENPQIRLVDQENQGQAAALNRGLDLARGDYITTLDVDDWFTANSLLERVRFLDKNPEFGAVYGDGYYCDVDGKPICRFSEFRIGSVDGDVYDVLISNPFFGTGANIMARRQVFTKQQLRYDESITWCQDHDIYIRMAESTSFGNIDEIILWYRLHEANMTLSISDGQRLESLLKTKLKVLDSPRFAGVSVDAKSGFFYSFLRSDLQGRFDHQTMVFEHPQFLALPKQQQARLLRTVANDYLLRGEEVQVAKGWLKQAWILAPFDPKTISASVLASLTPGLSRSILRRWRQMPSQKNGSANPFEGIGES